MIKLLADLYPQGVAYMNLMQIWGLLRPSSLDSNNKNPVKRDFYLKEFACKY